MIWLYIKLFCIGFIFCSAVSLDAGDKPENARGTKGSRTQLSTSSPSPTKVKPGGLEEGKGASSAAPPSASPTQVVDQQPAESSKKRADSVGSQSGALSHAVDHSRPVAVHTGIYKIVPGFVASAMHAAQEKFTDGVNALRCTRSVVLEAIESPESEEFFRQYPTPKDSTVAVITAIEELNGVNESKRDDDPLVRQAKIVEFALTDKALAHGVALPTESVYEHIRKSKAKRKEYREREKRILATLRGVQAKQSATLQELEKGK